MSQSEHNPSPATLRPEGHGLSSNSQKDTAGRAAWSGQVLAGRVVDAPATIRHHFLDYDALLQQVSKLDAGKALSVPIPEQIKRSAFDHLLRRAAIARGLDLSIRYIGGYVYLSQRLRPSQKFTPSANEERDKGILADLKSGQTQAQLARKHAVSRQRIQQIDRRYFVAGVSPKDRHSKMLEFAAPYLEVCDVKQCLLCDVALPERSGANLCDECKRRIKKINRVRTILSSYKKTGYPQSIRQAVYEIRKHNISPEEIGRKAQGGTL